MIRIWLDIFCLVYVLCASAFNGLRFLCAPNILSGWYQEGCPRRIQLNYKLEALCNLKEKTQMIQPKHRIRKVSMKTSYMNRKKKEFMCLCSFRIIFIFKMPTKSWKLNYSALRVFFSSLVSFHYMRLYAE